MKYILSFGGGVNSLALFFTLIEKKYPLDEILFADTGGELPETYALVEKFKSIAVEHNIPFTIAKSHYANSLYEYCFNKKTVPSRMRRDCTDKFKIIPMRKHLIAKYGKKETYVRYIGISAEEAHRVRESRHKYEEYQYPLVDLGISRGDCVRINEAHGFLNVAKSGCFFCPFTKKANWIKLLDEHPDLFKSAADLDDNSSNPNVHLATVRLSKIIKDRQGQRNLVDWDYFDNYCGQRTCDAAGGCFL